MAHNFKILDGDYYVSKDGNDTNDGLTPDTPWKSMDKLFSSGTSGKIVIGAGVYQLTQDLSNLTQSFDFYGDGKVVIDGGSTWKLECSAFGIDNLVLRNLTFSIRSLNGSMTVTNTVFLNISIRYQIVNGYKVDLFFNNGTMVNCDEVRDGTSGMLKTFTRSKFFNTVFDVTSPDVRSNVQEITDCYFDTASTFNLGTSAPNSSKFKNNDIEGVIFLNTDTFELKQKKDGSPADNLNAGISDISTVIADIYTTRKSFNEDPLFYNVAKGDYGTTVDIASPLLYAAQNPLESIGNVNFAIGRKITDASFTSPASSNDIATETGDFVVDDASVDGVAVIREAPVQFASKLTTVGLMLFGAALNFDSDEPLGSQENDNVLAVENYATGTAGANPRRLTYRMRWSTQLAMPTSDAEWDNQDYTAAAGDFAIFEVDTVPQMDLGGNGNGHPDFNSVTGGNIAAVWIQREIVIRNGLG